MQQNPAGQTPDQKKKEADKLQREKEKKAAEEAAREGADLFKPVQVQKVPFGVDPKTVLCQFFKKGHCDKGRKCKFSHDLNVERKGEKKSLYTDTREEDAETEKQKDQMDDWDEEKLRQVVMSKHGNPKTTTDKVCKFFVEAVEIGELRRAQDLDTLLLDEVDVAREGEARLLDAGGAHRAPEARTPRWGHPGRADRARSAPAPP